MTDPITPPPQCPNPKCGYDGKEHPAADGQAPEPGEVFREGSPFLDDGTCARCGVIWWEHALRQAQTGLRKINAIRNSIVGTQSIHWSEHIYPLIAALNEAGVEGQPYPEARENIGTVIDQLAQANERIAELEEQMEAQCERPPEGCECPGCEFAREREDVRAAAKLCGEGERDGT